jgi:hypothetical protein
MIRGRLSGNLPNETVPVRSYGSKLIHHRGGSHESKLISCDRRPYILQVQVFNQIIPWQITPLTARADIHKHMYADRVPACRRGSIKVRYTIRQDFQGHVRRSRALKPSQTLLSLHLQAPLARDNRPAAQARSPFLPGLTSPRINLSTSFKDSSGAARPEISESSKILTSPPAPRLLVGAVRARPPRKPCLGPDSRRMPALCAGDRAPPDEGSGRLRRWRPRGALPSPTGTQFSLSESVGEASRDETSTLLGLTFSRDKSWAEEGVTKLSSRPVLVLARLSFVRLAESERCSLEAGALRLPEPLGCSTLPLDDRSRLMAAVAEPVDSHSASAVSSSRVSASAHDSQARTSLDLPRPSRGGCDDSIVPSE